MLFRKWKCSKESPGALVAKSHLQTASETRCFLSSIWIEDIILQTWGAISNIMWDIRDVYFPPEQGLQALWWVNCGLQNAFTVLLSLQTLGISQSFLTGFHWPVLGHLVSSSDCLGWSIVCEAPLQWCPYQPLLKPMWHPHDSSGCPRWPPTLGCR